MTSIRLWLNAKTRRLNGRVFGKSAVLILVASKVREGAVCFGHTVGVFFLFEGSAGLVVGVNDFIGQALCIGHALAGPGGLHEPHVCQVLLPVPLDREWNLVIGAAHAAAFDLY